MKTIKNIIISSLATLPIIGFAREAPITATLPNPGTGSTTVQTVGDVQIIVTNIVGWIQVFFYIIATLMIVLAAWSFLNSGGEAEKTKEARTKVIYAVVAIAVALIAGGVVTLVKNFIE